MHPVLAFAPETPTASLIAVPVLLLAFATWVTAHLALVAALVTEAPRWRALVALAIPPLAFFWGVRHGWRWRSGLWLGALVVYAGALVHVLR